MSGVAGLLVSVGLRGQAVVDRIAESDGGAAPQILGARGRRRLPHRADDPEYIVRLVGQVVKVSLETVRIVKGLPGRYAQ